jgi:peptide/nickel transport system ATP-binding protein
MNAELLQIQDLHVSFSTRRGIVKAVNGATLLIRRGEIVGVVGESGSGKSVTALAVMGLLGRAGHISRGKIIFQQTDLSTASPEIMRSLRGTAISMIFQNPRGALNPIRTIGLQIADALRAHRKMSRRAARRQALDLLNAVRIHNAEQRIDALPHELSGGMCQRVMIAIAIACEPDLLIADEPTTGIDVTTQRTVLELITELVKQHGMAMLFITHDLGLAARYCQRVSVMERGRVVETAPPLALFSRPQDTYTARLVAASPTQNSTLSSLLGGNDNVARVDYTASEITKVRGSKVLLEVEHLTKQYVGGVTAVADVNIQIGRGESVGLVGESGSGKTTIARIISRLIDTSSGRVVLNGTDIGSIRASDAHRSPMRREVQLVFQDPEGSLNPRFNVFDSIADPIRRLMERGKPEQLRKRVEEIAGQVELSPELLWRFTHQLSGGQMARVGIARAIAVRPSLLILDEPTASLDVSVQAKVLNLLNRLRREFDITYLFVSHDLNVVRMMCDRIIVLQNGRIVEEGKSDLIFKRPQQSYTKKLIDSISHLDVGKELVGFRELESNSP